MPTRKRKRNVALGDKFSIIQIVSLSELPVLSTRNAALKWFSEQCEEVRLSIVFNQSSLIATRRIPGEVSTPEFFYSMLLLSINKAQREDASLGIKKKITAIAADEISRKKIARFIENKNASQEGDKYARIKRDFLGLIAVLLDKPDFSWADISSYLWNNYHFPITRDYARKCYFKALKELSEPDKEVRNDA